MVPKRLSPGKRVRVVKDITKHYIPLGCLVTVKAKHRRRNDAFYVREFEKTFVRVSEVEVVDA